MDFSKNKNYIKLNDILYEVDFCNITKRLDDGYNVNFFVFCGITKNRGLLKDLLHYNSSLTMLSIEILKSGLKLNIIDSIDNINIFEVKYITKSEIETYKPIDFEKLCNDKR